MKKYRIRKLSPLWWAIQTAKILTLPAVGITWLFIAFMLTA